MDQIHDPPSRKKWTVRGMVDKLARAISSPPDPLIGKEFDNYKIDQKIGRGGMANIYRASTASGAKVALKVLNDDYCRMEKAAVRFMSEALVIENVNHPNIVRGLGHGTIDSSRLYLAMEYIEGTDLDLELEEGRLPPEAAMRIILDVCRGLEAVHSAGIVHRDLKPGNIMLAQEGAKLIDFGISRPASSGGQGEWNGTIYGTINYVAPEQTSGDAHDARTDIYSLGVTAYRAVCGVLPIESDDDLVHMMELIRMMPPREPSMHVPGISEDIDRILMKALSKNPGSRFQSAGEMGREIEKYLSGA